MIADPSGSGDQKEKMTISEVDLDESLIKVCEGIGKTVAGTTLASAVALGEMYQKMFSDLTTVAASSKEIQDQVVLFASRFRPMNSAAFRYVVKLKHFSQAMQKDKIPSIQDALGSDVPDLDFVSDVVVEITEAFTPVVSLFNEVRDGYNGLCDEANATSVQAQHQHNVSAGQRTTAEVAEVAGVLALSTSATGAVALGTAIGVPGLAAWSTSVAAACMGPAGWIALIGVGAVAGGVAVGGGILAKKTHEQVMKDMEKVHLVMNEIVELVHKHSKELETICETLSKVASDSKILDKALSDWKDKHAAGRNIQLPCKRAKRQLKTMMGDCQKLENECDGYIETEKAGRFSAFKIIETEKAGLIERFQNRSRLI